MLRDYLEANGISLVFYWEKEEGVYMVNNVKEMLGQVVDESDQLVQHYGNRWHDYMMCSMVRKCVIVLYWNICFYCIKIKHGVLKFHCKIMKLFINGWNTYDVYIIGKFLCVCSEKKRYAWVALFYEYMKDPSKESRVKERKI